MADKVVDKLVFDRYLLGNNLGRRTLQSLKLLTRPFA